MKQTYFLKILIIFCLLNISGNIYGQSAPPNNETSNESKELFSNIDFSALIQKVDSQTDFKSVLVQKKLSNILIVSNDRKALNIFLETHKSVLGMTIINKGKKNPDNYYQLDLNVSFSSYQVEVILSEVKGRNVEEIKRDWVHTSNF